MTLERNLAWAASVIDRSAGRHPASQAAPPLALVDEAQIVLRTAGLWDYAEALLAGGNPLPRMAAGGDPAVFETAFRFAAEHHVDKWWDGVVSGKPVSAGTMTDAFVQRAGGEPGVVLASHLRVDSPKVRAEARVRVVQTTTWQIVIPRAVVRGEGAPIIEIVGGGRCHRETIRRSGWMIVGGWKAGGTNRIAGRPAGAAAAEVGSELREPKPSI